MAHDHLVLFNTALWPPTLTVILMAIVAITGMQPKGARSVSQTRLMGMGRLVLAALVIIFASEAFRARAGG